MPRPRASTVDKATAKVARELAATLAKQQADLASVERSTLPHNVAYADLCRSAIDRSESAIRNLEKNGLPAGFLEKWC